MAAVCALLLCVSNVFIGSTTATPLNPACRYLDSTLLPTYANAQQVDPSFNVVCAYNNQQADETFTVPAQVDRLLVFARGGRAEGYSGYPSGQPGYISADFSSIAGLPITVSVGGDGGFDGTGGRNSGGNAGTVSVARFLLYPPTHPFLRETSVVTVAHRKANPALVLPPHWCATERRPSHRRRRVQCHLHQHSAIISCRWSGRRNERFGHKRRG